MENKNIIVALIIIIVVFAAVLGVVFFTPQMLKNQVKLK